MIIHCILTREERSEAQRIGRQTYQMTDAEAGRVIAAAVLNLTVAEPSEPRAEAYRFRAWKARRGRIKEKRDNAATALSR